MARNRINVDENLKTPFNMSHFKRSLKYVTNYKGKMALAFALNFIALIVALFTPSLLAKLLDVAIPNKDIKLVIILGVLMLLCILINIIFATIKSKIIIKVGQNIIYDIRQDLFAHMQELPFTYYDNRPYGKILVRVVNYVNNVSDMLSNGLVNFVIDILNIIFITVFMFATNAKLALIVLSGLPFLLIIGFVLLPIQRKMWKNLSAKFSNLNAFISESISGVKISQLFTREKENEEMFSEIAKENKTMWMKTIWINAITPFAVDNIQNLVLMAVYVVGISMITGVTGGITVGVLFAMTNYASRFWQPIVSISNIYNSFINTIAYLERIFETMDEPIEECDKSLRKLPPMNGDVEFKNVTFGYLEDDVVLDNVSFKVKAGESIALVGPTGSGKTTIVNLLSKFYKARSGEIFIDGHNINEYSNNSIRSQMGIMLQDSFVFSGTILDNIIYGKRNATMEEVEKVCEITCCDEFIDNFEEGYDFVLNEKGACLSSGYRQLLSFARTLIADPKILILDEATASIDTKTEKLVTTAIDKMLKNRTSFIVAHRLSTISNCDRIIFIKDGKITESGSHKELIKLRGDYYNLYTSQ
ncbi:MAG: ABC transporter ATP-binding protein [Clostridia bacterium]